MVGIAQLVRAPGCGPGGHGFDPHYSPQQKLLICLTNEEFLYPSRRYGGLVYHQPVGLYIIAALVLRISSRQRRVFSPSAWWYAKLRFDEIQFLRNWWYTTARRWFITHVRRFHRGEASISLIPPAPAGFLFAPIIAFWRFLW